MVKKTELRIGHVFEKDGILINLTSTDIIELLSQPGKYVALNPVRITPDRLRQIGFETIRHWLDLYRSTCTGYIDIRYEIQAINGEEQITGGECDQGIGELPQYIHQLQDILHAILGQDLPFSRAALK